MNAASLRVYIMLSNAASGVMAKTAEMNLMFLVKQVYTETDEAAMFLCSTRVISRISLRNSLIVARANVVHEGGRAEPNGVEILEQHPYSSELTV